jgi:hypothetical protein
VMAGSHSQKDERADHLSRRQRHDEVS